MYSTNIVHNNAASISTQLNGNTGFLNALQPTGSGGSTPQAYLTILFFDERFNFISAEDGGVAQQQVASTYDINGPPLGLANIKAPKNGYAYVYVSNRSDQHVYFDNLQVSNVSGNIIEENHYYAFGLKIAGISSKKLGDANEGKLKNPYQYNGKEMLDEDADLNWLDYGFRNYDPQIGRFPQLDPLTDDYPFLTPYQYASNDPITNIDVDGLEGSGAVGGAVSDFFQGSQNILQSEVIIVAIKAAKPVQNTAALTKAISLSMSAIKIASTIVRAQVASKTLNHFSSAPDVKAQISRAVDEFAANHLELDASDIFALGIKTSNYFKGLNLMAWWAKGDFEQLDRTAIKNESGNLTDAFRVSLVEEGIKDEQRGVAGILGESANVAFFISSLGLFPDVGPGLKGSTLKFQTLPQVSREASVTIGTMEDGVMIFSSKSGGHTIEGIANFKVEGEKLFLDQLHLQGAAAGSIGRKSIWQMARNLGRQFKVKEVVIQGGRRTTGNFNGQLPSPVTIKIE